VKSEDYWKSIEDNFSEKAYASVLIDGAIISPLGFNKFSSLNLERVTTLSIANVILTKEMLDRLFTHPLLKQLLIL
jgi:hypothetical protein